MSKTEIKTDEIVKTKVLVEKNGYCGYCHSINVEIFKYTTCSGEDDYGNRLCEHMVACSECGDNFLREFDGDDDLW